MGLLQPKKYKVKRDGVWVTITPEPVEMGIPKFDRKTYQKNRHDKLKAERKENGL